MQDGPPDLTKIGDFGFNAYAGPIFRTNENAFEERTFLLDVQDHQLDDRGEIHPGLLLSLADTVLGRAAFSSINEVRCVTVSLNCNIIGTARLGDRVEGQSRVTKQARDIIFVEGALSVNNVSILVGTGLWKKVGP